MMFKHYILLKTFTFFIVSAGLIGCGDTKNSPPANTLNAQEEHRNSPAPLNVMKQGCPQFSPPDQSYHEVFVEDMADGQDGDYRLVEAQMFEQTDFIPQNKRTQFIVGIRLSAHANLDNPDFKVSLDCKNMDDAPEGEATGAFKAPVSISRKDAKLVGRISTSFNLYGEKTNRQDQIPQYYDRSPSSWYQDLQALKKALANAGTVHLYKVGDRFELRTSQTAENGERRYLVFARYVYVYSGHSL